MPPTITEIPYELHLAADLHIGSGVGLPGVIDEYVVRDHEGFAYTPFSEVKGIVRDNCVQLMKYLGCDNNTKYACDGHRAQIGILQGSDPPAKGFCGLAGAKLCALCAIFGSRITPARWWFSPARYSETYCESVLKFKTDDAPDAWNQFARRDSATSAHAAIDPLTKRAAEDHLFNLEVVRLPDTSPTLQKVAVWEGHIIYQTPLPQEKKAELADDELLGWLLAALLFTRRIGGRRRRGWGRCRFVLSGGNKSTIEQRVENWLNHLQAERVLNAGG
jgi:CRISPR/Cas system CSM-associated protein Csm3 (group 7 of RAMP superfamily)